MIEINREACIGCGKCVSDCIGSYITLEDQKAVMNKECFQCGHCVAVCPKSAVSIPDYDMADVESIDTGAGSVTADHLLHMIKCRRSIRNYKHQPVEQEKLEKLIQAGRYTATAKNNQGSRFIFVQNDLNKLKDCVWNNVGDLVNRPYKEISKEFLPYAAFYKQHKEDPQNDYLFRNAPVVVYITSDWPLDGGLAAQNMELMAIAEGLGLLYNGFLARISEQNQELKAWLGIEDTTIRVCMLLGYPNVLYQRSAPRKEANVIWR